MRRLFGTILALVSLASFGVGLSLVLGGSSSNELRLFGMLCVGVAVGLGLFSLVLLSGPIGFARDTSVKSLGVALVFLAVAVVIKACG